MSDMIASSERLTWRTRLKAPAQAMAGIGLARRLRHRGVRHVHCHFAHAPTTVGMYAARQLDISFSFTGHANDLFQRRALLKRKLQRASFVCCISRWHESLYRDLDSNLNGKLKLVRCGVDTTAWSTTTTKPAPPEAVRLLTVGRLVEKKGIDTLIRAAGSLVKNGQALAIDIVGDGPMRGAWQQLADEEGLSRHTNWHGSLPNDQVHDLMKEADVFVLPCREDTRGDRDGIPVVLMEAMACGLPVISGDLPAIRELVTDRQTGLLVPGGDVKTLATALEEVIGSAGLRAMLGRSGRQRVVEEFDLTRNVERLDAVLQSTLNNAMTGEEGPTCTVAATA